MPRPAMSAGNANTVEADNTVRFQDEVITGVWCSSGRRQKEGGLEKLEGLAKEKNGEETLDVESIGHSDGILMADVDVLGEVHDVL